MKLSSFTVVVYYTMALPPFSFHTLSRTLMNENIDNSSKNSKSTRFSEPPSSIYFNPVEYNGVLLLRTRNLRSEAGNCIVEMSGGSRFLRLWSI